MILNDSPAYYPEVADAEIQGVDLIFEAGATVTAKDWVMVDLSTTTHGRGRSVIQATAALRHQCVGVAMNGGTVGKKIRVRVNGVATGVNVADAAAAGDPLTIAGNGRADLAAITTILTVRVVGFALTNGSASNTADVFVQCM